MERHMSKKLIVIGVLMVLGMTFLAMGCCKTPAATAQNPNPQPRSFLSGVCPTATEKDYGHSVANNKAHMIINTEAYRKVETSVGLSPKATANVMDMYNKSFAPTDSKGTTMKLTTEK